MRKIIITIAIAWTLPLNGQSVLTLGSGTSLGILTGADLCADIINGQGILHGGGTICGGLVGIEPQPLAGLPTSFEMSQNYPNPFNPVTVINYQLPKSAFVSLKIYDQLGRETAVLFEGEQPAGFYQARVAGTELAAGVYFCRINAGNYSKAIKMSLVK